MDTGRFQAEFGRKVRELRLARGLSQEALAAAAGLHPTHISLIETGKRVVRLTTIQNLAVGLKIQPSELMPPLK